MEGWNHGTAFGDDSSGIGAICVEDELLTADEIEEVGVLAGRVDGVELVECGGGGGGGHHAVEAGVVPLNFAARGGVVGTP